MFRINHKPKPLAMKKANIFSLSLFFCLIYSSSIAQWQQAKGLDGGALRQMVCIDSTFFATLNDGGLVKKIGNQPWDTCYFSRPYVFIKKVGTCLFLYGQAEDFYCLRSCDLGQTWDEMPHLGTLYQIYPFDTIMVFRSADGFFRSFDKGNTFHPLPFPQEYSPRNLFSDDSLLFAEVFYDDDDRRLFCSANQGTSWDSIPINQVFQNDPYFDITHIKKLKGNYWMILQSETCPYSFHKYFVFDQSEQSWKEATANLPIYTGTQDICTFQGKITASLYQRPVYQFNEEDSTWAQFTSAQRQINSFMQHQGKLYCTADQGACLLDGTGCFSNMYEGLNYREVSSLARHNGKLYGMANNELFYSEDAGQNFTQIPSAYGKQIITTDSLFYARAIHDFMISDDQGLSWQSYMDGLEFMEVHNYTNTMSIAPGYYFLGAYEGIFRSPSQSIYWERLDNGIPQPSYEVNQVTSIDSTVIFTHGPYPTGMYYSSDYGESFVDYGESCRLKSCGLNYYRIKGNNGGNSDSLLCSYDLGQSWKSINIDTPGRIYSLDRRNDTMVIGGGASPRFLQITYDLGQCWENINDGLPEAKYGYPHYIMQIKMFDNGLFVSNPGIGLWYRKDLLTHIDATQNNMDFQEVKVFPNPVKSSCIFAFELQYPSELNLKIFNQQGFLVETIKIAEKVGKQEINWQSNNLPTGPYFYKLQTKKQVFSGKFMLVE
jgi:type IX secretion system substrate protein